MFIGNVIIIIEKITNNALPQVGIEYESIIIINIIEIGNEKLNILISTTLTLKRIRHKTKLKTIKENAIRERIPMFKTGDFEFESKSPPKKYQISNAGMIEKNKTIKEDVHPFFVFSYFIILIIYTRHFS